jgi:hypothetical protein
LPFFVLILALTFLISDTVAQTTSVRENFNLSRSQRDTTGANVSIEELEKTSIGIKKGKLETSLTLGFLDLNQTLLSHSKLIYKYTDEATFYGDVELTGQSAFYPVLRISYNVTPWLSLEPTFHFSVSEYEASIVDRKKKPRNQPVEIEEPSLGEFDAERRSLVTIGAGFSSVLYPFNINGSGNGRWHPFLTGGLGKTWFNLNSDYTQNSSLDSEYWGGGGIRFIADDLISIRIEFLYHSTVIDLDPTLEYARLNEGSPFIPVLQWEKDPVTGLEREIQVNDFGSQRLSSLSWGIGFTATF